MNHPIIIQPWLGVMTGGHVLHRHPGLLGLYRLYLWHKPRGESDQYWVYWTVSFDKHWRRSKSWNATKHHGDVFATPLKNIGHDHRIWGIWCGYPNVKNVPIIDSLLVSVMNINWTQFLRCSLGNLNPLSWTGSVWGFILWKHFFKKIEYILWHMNTYDILMSPMKIIQVCFNMGDAPMCGNLNRKIMTLTVGFGIV
jgi:hypothetical protein